MSPDLNPVKHPWKEPQTPGAEIACLLVIASKGCATKYGRLRVSSFLFENKLLNQKSEAKLDFYFLYFFLYFCQLQIISGKIVGSSFFVEGH